VAAVDDILSDTGENMLAKFDTFYWKFAYVDTCFGECVRLQAKCTTVWWVRWMC